MKRIHTAGSVWSKSETCIRRDVFLHLWCTTSSQINLRLLVQQLQWGKRSEPGIYLYLGQKSLPAEPNVLVRRKQTWWVAVYLDQTRAGDCWNGKKHQWLNEHRHLQRTRGRCKSTTCGTKVESFLDILSQNLYMFDFYVWSVRLLDV